jgi:hypothetical protein
MVQGKSSVPTGVIWGPEMSFRPGCIQMELFRIIHHFV